MLGLSFSCRRGEFVRTLKNQTSWVYRLLKDSLIILMQCRDYISSNVDYMMIFSLWSMKESQSFCSHQMVFSKWSKNTFLSYLEVSKNSQDFELKNHVMCLYTTVWRALDSSHRKNSPMPHFCSVWLHTFFQCYHASQQAIENTIMVTSEFFLYFI